MDLRSKSTVLLVISLLLSFTEQTLAQLCNGSFGDPVVLIDFGRGTDFFGPSLGNKTSYSYVTSTGPSDGSYTIEQSVGYSNQGGSWHYIKNHTPNDPEGYLMMINASFNPGIFYETDVPTDLCPNTTYEFACWVTNLLRFRGIRPNLTFQILSMDDQILQTFSTGDIPETTEPTWKQYGGLFNTPDGVNRIKIRIINNAPGGAGNDLAIDDITFRACGTKITTSIDNIPNQTTKAVCENEPISLSITSSTEGSNTLQYLWQTKNGETWRDLNEETNPQITINTSGLSTGNNEYRVLVAEPSNFGAPACRTASAPIIITVKPAPQLSISSNYSICVGQSQQLELTGTDGTYLWTGPNNFSSTLKSPTISNAGPNEAGTYQVIVTANGCTNSIQTNLTVIPQPVAAVNQPPAPICYGASILLEASGGNSYKWSPTTGLSDPNIANPIASPTHTTTYEVTVSNGFCEDKAQVTVNVYQQILANAGSNKVIMEGESTTLDGTVSGDNLEYFWTPSKGLDDPKKLTPIATPLATTTYTLNVASLNNCNGATSSMTVKVFKKVIIPNTFTPNGDGINDVWNIEALQAYPNAEVKVMNRFGERVFSAKGNFQNWDGWYKGKSLPVGTYFYWIDLHEAGQKPLVGPVTILK
ncbi:gliding motility-associated C-terminal domain-containing protein [Pedobacter polysacchareus]|uniref:gliding motility-associated C-terminal domain-containing protein n=1 Tax=Pedobacter polysacchareus TaxID=2861973 RepID=UPI001C9924F6|nr:gliding motility-associated C-terminal domain-containing protein [Pedobacter polysacchareus]